MIDLLHAWAAPPLDLDGGVMHANLLKMLVFLLYWIPTFQCIDPPPSNSWRLPWLNEYILDGRKTALDLNPLTPDVICYKCYIIFT